MNNQNAYAKPVTLRHIFTFAVPTIAMTVFMSFYTMADGLFVANFIGTDALSAINLTAPVISLVTAISTMLATGGSAVIMKKMGERKEKEAREDFTFLILVNVVVGILMCGIGYAPMGAVFERLRLSAAVAAYCAEYISRYLLFTVPVLLMNNFTLYMIASEKATLSFLCSVAGGILNIALDYVFLAVLDLGIGSAAIATGLDYSVTAVVGCVVFMRKKSLLHFVKPVVCLNALRDAAANGCSEMATALVTGIVTMLFNGTMLYYVGENGVADVCQLFLYGIFLRRCADDQFLLRRAESGKAQKAASHQQECDSGKFRFDGGRFVSVYRAAGFHFRPASKPGVRLGGNGKQNLYGGPAFYRI